MKKVGILLAILLIAGVCAMADDAVPAEQGAVLFADIDAVALSQAEMAVVDGARNIRENAGESLAFARDKTDYEQGCSYDGLVGQTVRASVRCDDGNYREVAYEMTGARQTSKSHIELQGNYYRITKGRDTMD